MLHVRDQIMNQYFHSYYYETLLSFLMTEIHQKLWAQCFGLILILLCMFHFTS